MDRGVVAVVRDGCGWPLPHREVHFALENDGWSCTFECEVHISAPGAVRGGRRRGPRAPLARRSARCGRRPARGAPPGGPRRRGLSKSATKARIGPERARRNVDIPRFRSRPIPPRGAFVADFDTPPPRAVPGAPPAPRRHLRNNFPDRNPRGKRRHVENSPSRRPSTRKIRPRRNLVRKDCVQPGAVRRLPTRRRAVRRAQTGQ